MFLVIIRVINSPCSRLSSGWLETSFRQIISLRPGMKFKEFEPRFKSAKTRFKLSAGLNLETFETIWPRLKFKPPLKFFKFGPWWDIEFFRRRTTGDTFACLVPFFLLKLFHLFLFPCFSVCITLLNINFHESPSKTEVKLYIEERLVTYFTLYFCCENSKFHNNLPQTGTKDRTKRINTSRGW